jgi:hypothetical protein
MNWPNFPNSAKESTLALRYESSDTLHNIRARQDIDISVVSFICNKKYRLA